MATAPVLLPGEVVPHNLLPKSKKGQLTIGPGLYHCPPSTISATTAGTLLTDPRKAALWLDHIDGRYLPSLGDLIIAQIHHSSVETYSCALTPHTPFALLGQLAFEGVSKKTRPQLTAGDLVNRRVSKVSTGEDVEILSKTTRCRCK